MRMRRNGIPLFVCEFFLAHFAEKYLCKRVRINRKEKCSMLHEVKFRCGHTCMMDLTGQAEEREKKAEWYTKHIICPDCRMNAAILDERYGSFQQERNFPVGMFSVHLSK